MHRKHVIRCLSLSPRCDCAMTFNSVAVCTFTFNTTEENEKNGNSDDGDVSMINLLLRNVSVSNKHGNPTCWMQSTRARDSTAHGFPSVESFTPVPG